MFKILISNFIKTQYLKIRVYRPRNKWMTNLLLEEMRNQSELPPLNPSEEQDIVNYWGRYGNSAEYRFYKKYQKEFSLTRFVPWRYYLDVIDPFFCKAIEARYIDNKNLYDLFFHELPLPKTIAHFVNGELLSNDYSPMSRSQLVERCREAGNVIVKPALMSNGGHGLFFWNSSMDDEALINGFSHQSSFIIQEVMHQHPLMSAIHQSSVNTVRLITFFFEGEVYLLSSFLRMGQNGSLVDNTCSGGLFCGVKPDGRLNSIALSSDGSEYLSHPQGVVFSEFKVPSFDRCVSLVKFAAPRFADVAKIISWDIAVDANGNPIIIETNFGWPNVVHAQIASGPLFGETDLLNAVQQHIKKYNH